MQLSRARLLVPLVTILLIAAACGGSSGPSRTEAIDSLTEDGGLDREQATCVIDGIEDIDGVSLSDLDSDDAPSPEAAEAVVELIGECVGLNDLAGGSASDDDTTTTTSSVPATTEAMGDESDELVAPPGLDARLDELWVSCADGDDAACEDLYWESDFGSEYEAFGADCGGRGTCQSVGLDGPDFSDLSPTDPPPGTDAELDALWVGCSEGSADACDQLFFQSPADSDYERFGFSCGARANDNCADILGDGDDRALSDFSDLNPTDPAPGIDAELDELWAACGAGGADACDELYFEAPLGSVYERFGYSCGARAIDVCSTLLD